MRKIWMIAGVAVVLAGCTDRTQPLAPTAIAGPTPIAPVPSLPTTVPGVLAIGMPIDAADLASSAFGLTPFGAHVPGHAEDGHAGWDIEYRAGGMVRAAAAGTVQSVTNEAGRFTVRIEHIVGAHHYQTTYTNLGGVIADISAGEAVAARQPLGTPGTVGTAGTLGTHFQLDDFEYYREVSHPNAVSPEPFLTADGRQLLDRIWSTAAYAQELTEPYITNSRDLTLPASRTWTRAGGDGPAGVRFTRLSARTDEYEYALLAESGTITETGTVILTPTSRPYSSIDLMPSASAPRLGVYEIVSNELRLSLAQPGSARPADLSAASVYRVR